jgi:DNA-directed RNA polymerase specialized sigma24 family protein
VLGEEFPGVLRAAAGGDESAFARLWRDTHPPLLRYLRVAAGDGAEDVASQVWLEVARKLPRFRGGERNFRAWLFTTARRMLRVVAGLDADQVARIVGKRPGTVRVAVHRAVRALGARLVPLSGERGVTR